METCSVYRFMRLIYMSSKLQMISLTANNKKRGERYPFSLDQRTTDNFGYCTRVRFTAHFLQCISLLHLIIFSQSWPFLNFFELNI